MTKFQKNNNIKTYTVYKYRNNLHEGRDGNLFNYLNNLAYLIMDPNSVIILEKK